MNCIVGLTYEYIYLCIIYIKFPLLFKKFYFIVYAITVVPTFSPFAHLYPAPPTASGHHQTVVQHVYMFY